MLAAVPAGSAAAFEAAAGARLGAALLAALAVVDLFALDDLPGAEAAAGVTGAELLPVDPTGGPTQVPE